MPIFYRNSRLEFERERTNNPTIGNRENYQGNRSMREIIDSRPESGNKKTEKYQECRKVGLDTECRERERTVPDRAKDQLNKELNDAVRNLSSSNETLNTRNTRRNTGYEQAVNVGNSATGGDYTSRRGSIRTNNSNANLDDDAKNSIEQKFKDFYRGEKLQRWNNSGARQPLYGDFDPVYYSNDSQPGAKTTWLNAVADDDIDITERYRTQDNNYDGNDTNTDPNVFYQQHYTNVAPSNARGNRAELTDQATAYKEEAPLDTEVEQARTLMLNIDHDSQTDRLLGIQEVQDEWDAAKGGDPYWKRLAREKFLDVGNEDDFAALFRIAAGDTEGPTRADDRSRWEAIRQISFDYATNTGYGLTELEDAVNEAAGEKANVDVRKFAALGQNVLKDAIAEMKEAKKKETFMSTVGGFTGFGEIMDVNKSLTESILGDSGVGGYLNMISGGKAEESLENALQGMSGVNNNVSYNWQKWFGEKLTEKYGIDYTRFLPLDQKTYIVDASKSPKLTTNPYDSTTNTFTDEFLELANFENTEELNNFLQSQGTAPGSDGAVLNTILKEKWNTDIDTRMGVVDRDNGQSMNTIENTVKQDLDTLNAEKDRDLNLTLEREGHNPEDVRIEAKFARDFINRYLNVRFDTSKSMDEFQEYLDVRQEEQNPFQTQDILNALKQEGDMQADAYLDAVQNSDDRRFDADFYFNPTKDEARTTEYAAQKQAVESAWEDAKAGRTTDIPGGTPINWAQQAYRFGITDLTNKADFARMHYQIIGKGRNYDAADDIMNTTKIKDFIYGRGDYEGAGALKALEGVADNQGTVFGNFITPEEFADDLLQGVDPGDKTQDSEWNAILQQYGLENFQGSFDELKEFIIETMRTGSAQRIRENIKYLNEKRKKPTQAVLGISYIAREEDADPGKIKAETELYATFQKSGFQGTEDEFYENFFPDLNRNDQVLLSKAGKDTPLKTWGLDLEDPFSSLGQIESFFAEETATEQQKERERFKVEAPDDFRSFFKIDLQDPDRSKTRQKEQDTLAEFTSLFKGF